MKVVFRADASTRIGTGHVTRCLTLGESLRKRGAEIRFICREHSGNLIAKIRESGIPATPLPGLDDQGQSSSEDYAAWLGVTPAADADETIQAVRGEGVDWLVVDNYALEAEWEQRLRPYAGRLMVIDDLANRGHDCDVLLDQNYTVHDERGYARLVPATCLVLTGPRYSLLRPEYAEYRRNQSSREGRARKVLLFFGGSDTSNMTRLALDALSRAELKDLEVDVVIGANNPHRGSIEDRAQARGKVRVYGPRPHLADLMAGADLAVGAGGSTIWEQMCLGLPSIVISTAENQRPSSEALAGEGMIRYAGPAAKITVSALAEMIRKLSTDVKALAELGTKGQLLVDGLGATRACELLYPTATYETLLRPAREEDVIFYYNWANERAVRSSAVHTEPILWESHRKWFAHKMRDEESRLFVMEAKGLPVGQIRFDAAAGEARISYSLDPIVRGRGWGKRLVELGVDAFRRRPAARPVCLHADVRIGNDASSAVFLRTGFVEKPSPLGTDYRAFYLDLR
jgi:UDP-2,4-diacetamido-2,4,6-trideoxy-beta-L-altropyranose hydrolase